mmetsp:Transcript_93226/g.241325  ORF Transcript_93226/g.241325 Transcript_93226/m.241325 type:complete len:121 (+) Transcript_93226:229-591(+)
MHVMLCPERYGVAVCKEGSHAALWVFVMHAFICTALRTRKVRRLFCCWMYRAMIVLSMTAKSVLSPQHVLIVEHMFLRVEMQDFAWECDALLPEFCDFLAAIVWYSGSSRLESCRRVGAP